MARVNVEGRVGELPQEPQRVIREIAQEINAYAGYIYVGAGSPEAVIAAPIGAIYLRTDGGAGTSMYSKEADSGLATGWVGK